MWYFDIMNSKQGKSIDTSIIEATPIDNINNEMHNIDAERALLGSLLLNGDQFTEIEEILQHPSAFYVPRHQKIFEAMRYLVSEGNGIDAVSVQSRMADSNDLEIGGGTEYITNLIETAPSVVNITNYANIICEKHIRRQLQISAEKIATISRQSEKDIEDVMNEVEKEIFDVTQKHATSEHKDINSMISGIVDEIIEVSDGKERSRGVSSGYASIDKKLSGFHKSDLIILAARPSVGKTTLALDIARKSAMQFGTKVGILSLEMSSAQLIERLLASESQLDAWNMRTGKLSSKEHFGSLTDAAEKLRKLPIYIDDRSSMSTLNIRSTARKMKMKKDIDLLIVDYLQLIQPHKNIRSDSLVQHITEVSRTLKQIARELEIPVLALSQLSRDVEKRSGTPRLSDLRDSGSIEQDADVVMFLHRNTNAMYEGESSDAPTPIDLMIEKHRNGPTGKVSLLLDNKHTTFLEPASKEYEGVPEATQF